MIEPRDNRSNFWGLVLLCPLFAVYAMSMSLSIGPTDQEALMALGRYYCFQTRNHSEN